MENGSTKGQAVLWPIKAGVRFIKYAPHTAPFELLMTWKSLLGLALVFFVYIPGEPLHPNQFGFPKEIAFGLVATFYALDFLYRNEKVRIDLINGPALALLVWSAFLIPFTAINRSTAIHDVGMFAAGLLFFLYARKNASNADTDKVYTLLCVLVGTLAALALLESFGVLPWISTAGRRPGATLGNRNVLARVLCLSLPLIWRQTQISNATRQICLLYGVSVITVAAIVFSRSRGAWLVACVLALSCPILSMTLCENHVHHHCHWKRVMWVLGLAVGIAVALLSPTRLGWNREDFASTGSRVFDYQTGTGRGCVIQAKSTLGMIRDYPLRGVGPGNWAIVYPRYAAAGDPSFAPNEIVPVPTIPRGDELYFLAELGLPALVFGVLTLLGIFMCGKRLIVSDDPAATSLGVMLFAVTAGVVLLGFVDPVLRMAPLLVFVSYSAGLAVGESSRLVPSHSTSRRISTHFPMVVCGLLSLLFAVGALRDTAAFQILRSAHSVNDLYRAVAVAPDNVEARAWLGEVLTADGRCDLAATQLNRAAALQPFSRFIKQLRTRCGLPEIKSGRGRSGRGRTD